MDLTGDPWIPVTLPGAGRSLVSLRQAFERAHEIRDLVATPPQRIALMRLLVCIAQAALDGPEDEEGWVACKPRIAPASLDYLARWRCAFELYGPKAFLQVPNLQATDSAVIDKLDFGLSAGNNATLFDHDATPAGRQQSPAWHALMLLTFQCFSPGGLIGVTCWNGVPTTKSSEAAPCLESAPLHTILLGETLLETIHRNLLTKQTVRAMPGGGWGSPVWERMPIDRADTRVGELSTCYLGRLVPISRAIKLVPGSATFTLANGLSYPKLPEAREPGTTVVLDRKTQAPKYVRVDPTKHPWRELGSVLAISPTHIEGGPIALRHLRHLDPESVVSVWTGGLAASKAKVLDVTEWGFDVRVSMLCEGELHKYQLGVELADTASRCLARAVGAYLEDLAVSELKRKEGGTYARNDKRSREYRTKLLEKGSRSFWSRLDARHRVLLDAACDPTVSLGGAWYGIVRRAVDDAYGAACPHETPRQIRAFAKGAQRLRLRKPE